MSAPHYLLDTNVLVQFIRASEVWVRVRDAYQLLTTTPSPRISVVTEGELRSLATQWDWGERKLDQVEYCLSVFEKLTIDTPAIIRAYAALDAHCESIGHKMGKNDLWIAATASVTGATLLTTDRDFDHLAPRYVKLKWIDPDTTKPAPA